MSGKLTVEEVQKELGSLFTVDRKGYWIRIQTPFTYFDGDCVDVFIHETYLVITVTDFGESVRIALNRSFKYPDPERTSLMCESAKTLNVDFHNNFINKVIGHGIKDLKDAVTRVGLIAVMVGAVY